MFSQKTGSRLIVLEGVDDVGKTTIAHELVKFLHNKNEDAIYMSFPGKEDGLGKIVYDIHHGTTKMNALSKQMLHVASHIDVIYSKIKSELPAIFKALL